ncbi:recombinase family protein [Streptomyces sp. NPDC050988]|uniref:recombinase family protein n=1 Tax=Streptomyces sp. NPDC050988 TaxID=3365637 RepID=UPI00379A71C7
MAIQYHTARFCLVPQLAKTLSVPTPAVRKPGAVRIELPRPVSAGAEPVGHVRLGYARASTARQSLDAQLDSLAEAGVTRVFSEKFSTGATRRPELEAAVKLAGEIRSSGVTVTLVVHEHKRLGRGIELAMLAEELKASGVGLEFLPGELKGSHDPSGIVSPCSRPCPAWSVSTSATALSKATSPPASGVRPSVARASPTRTCCLWPSTCATRRRACATSPNASSSLPALTDRFRMAAALVAASCQAESFSE